MDESFGNVRLDRSDRLVTKQKRLFERLQTQKSADTILFGNFVDNFDFLLLPWLLRSETELPLQLELLPLLELLDEDAFGSHAHLGEDLSPEAIVEVLKRRQTRRKADARSERRKRDAAPELVVQERVNDLVEVSDLEAVVAENRNLVVLKQKRLEDEVNFFGWKRETDVESSKEAKVLHLPAASVQKIKNEIM